MTLTNEDIEKMEQGILFEHPIAAQEWLDRHYPNLGLYYRFDTHGAVILDETTKKMVAYVPAGKSISMDDVTEK